MTGLFRTETDVRTGKEKIIPLTPEEIAELQARPAPFIPYDEKRRNEYPPLGDQLDAIWKELNYRRMNGDDLTAEADSVLNKVLAVKAKYPKD